MRPLIIGIAGGTGSGKTTLVENLKEQFGADISVLPHDNYYAAHHDMSLEERQTLNYDHPAAFDTDRMIQDLEDRPSSVPSTTTPSTTGRKRR